LWQKAEAGLTAIARRRGDSWLMSDAEQRLEAFTSSDNKEQIECGNRIVRKERQGTISKSVFVLVLATLVGATVSTFFPVRNISILL
jgi:hypothetical protein